MVGSTKRPSVSQTAWSYMTGKVCNDSNSCSHTDRCVSGGGGCAGTAYSCSDGLSCTDDVCNGSGGCSNPIISGRCKIGGSCYLNGALFQGSML